MVKDTAGVNRDFSLFGAALGAVRLFIEIWFGIFFLLVDLIKLLVKSISQSTGLSIRTVGREGEDELQTGKRLILASSYRHTRNYLYVRDVGPETYVGWFTHHEPLPGTASLVVIASLFLIFGAITGAGLGVPFIVIFGIALGLAYTFWFGPWLLARAGALPQPRYISGLITALYVFLMLIGYSMLDSLTSPTSLYGGRSLGRYGADPFTMMLIVSAITAFYVLVLVALIVLFRTVMMNLSHYDHFDAETHSKIVKERTSVILAESLESAGYTDSEIGDILEQKIPGAGRYRRARS